MSPNRWLSRGSGRRGARQEPGSEVKLLQHCQPAKTAHPDRNVFQCIILRGGGFSRSLFCSQDSGRRRFARTSRSPSPGSQPLFQKHCYGCHGIEKPKGKLRIDKLDPDFVKGNDGDHWRDVLDRLNFGDMPPAKEPALKKEDRELMTAWLAQEHRRAALAKNQATHFRRLTRREYERTMQDLLGLPIEFGDEASRRRPIEGRLPQRRRRAADVAVAIRDLSADRR